MTRKTAYLITLLLCACGGPSKPPSQKPASPSASASPSEQKEGFATPEEALAWVVTIHNAGGKVTEADLRARFDETFLKAIPPEQFIQSMAAAAEALGEITQRGKPTKQGEALIATFESKVGQVRAMVALSQEQPRKIVGLIFKPLEVETPKSYEETVSWLKESGKSSSLYVAELKNGKCKKLHGENEATPLAIGSSFKLWVLYALGEKLGPAATAWDQTMAISDTNKTLPGGVLQNEDTGTTLPLRDFAGKMISISDNTATDHLIDFVGRDQVEKALKTTGHSAAKRNIPFFKSRDLFALKLAASPEELAAYRKAPLSGKREMLVELSRRPLKLEDANDWTAPRHLDLEWFASGKDMCSVYASLGKLSKFDPNSEVLKALSANPGIAFQDGAYKYVGYKGGSEPGVLHMDWLLQRADGRWFVVSVGVNDDTHEIDGGRLVGVATALTQMLAREQD